MSLAWRTIRFQSDENVDAAIIAGLLRRQPAIDILTATQAGLLGQGDPLVLAYAADQGRILLTHDEKTMPGHLANFLMSGRQSPGVLIIEQELPIRQAIDSILLVWEASVPDDWRDQCSYLPL